MKKTSKYVYLLQGKELSKTGDLVNVVPIVTTSSNVIQYFIKHAESVKITHVSVINKAPKPEENK